MEDLNKLNQVALKLSEMGHPVRLQIIKYAIKSGDSGISVGEIKSRLGIPGSTLSHHINRLVNVDLIVQKRDKQTLNCSANYKNLMEIISYLQDECCQGNTD